jgi:tetratricopeptide (TPR) repeat protein
MTNRKEMLEQFLAQDPNDSFSRYALALELEKAGEQQEAVRHFQEVIARDPSYLAAYYHLGKVLARTGHAEEARDVYRRGLDVAIASGDQRTQSEIAEALETLE